MINARYMELNSQYRIRRLKSWWRARRLSPHEKEQINGSGKREKKSKAESTPESQAENKEDEMTKKQIKKILESLNFLILAIKASGGYKYRERLKLSEREIDLYIAGSESNLKNMVISQMVAEEMLQERGYWDREPRWQEYQERRKEALEVKK